MESPSSRPCANFYGSHIRPFLKPSVGISSWVSEVALLSSNEDLGIKSPPWALCPRWAVTLSLRTLILCDLEMWSVWSWWWVLRTHVVNLLPLPLGTHLPLQPLLQPTSAVSCNLPTVLTRHRELQSEQMVLCLPKQTRSSAFTRHCNPALCSSMHRACSRRRVGGEGGVDSTQPFNDDWLIICLRAGRDLSSPPPLSFAGEVQSHWAIWMSLEPHLVPTPPADGIAATPRAEPAASPASEQRGWLVPRPSTTSCF